MPDLTNEFYALLARIAIRQITEEKAQEQVKQEIKPTPAT